MVVTTTELVDCVRCERPKAYYARAAQGQICRECYEQEMARNMRFIDVVPIAQPFEQMKPRSTR